MEKNYITNELYFDQVKAVLDGTLLMPDRPTIRKYENRKEEAVTRGGVDPDNDYAIWGWALTGEDEEMEIEGRIFNTWVNFCEWFKSKKIPQVGEIIKVRHYVDNKDHKLRIMESPRIDNFLHYEDDIVMQVQPLEGDYGPFYIYFDFDQGQWQFFET